MGWDPVDLQATLAWAAATEHTTEAATMKLPTTKQLVKQVGFELRIRRLSREDRRRLRSGVAGRRLN